MEVLKQRLKLREVQISDMKRQISDIVSDTTKLDKEIREINTVIGTLQNKIQEKHQELEIELKIKEEGLIKLEELELSVETTTDNKKLGKNQDVVTAYIEFHTRSIQDRPMFKKLPEFNDEPEPCSPVKMNDSELDEELEKLGLSDVLKKYS